jgi:hypothetical protein
VLKKNLCHRDTIGKNAVLLWKDAHGVSGKNKLQNRCGKYDGILVFMCTLELS